MTDESGERVETGDGGDDPAPTITVDDRPYPWREGLTVQELLDELDPDFPMYVVKLDGRMIPRAEYDSTTVPVGASVRIVYMIAGG